MSNAFFGKTIENVRDRTNLDFIDHSKIEQIINRQSKLSFKGIVDHLFRTIKSFRSSL